MQPGATLRRKRGLSAKEQQASGQIYAVFEVEKDPDWQNCEWDGRRLMDLLEEHEAQRKHRPLKPLGVRSAHPRILSLRDLLKAIK